MKIEKAIEILTDESQSPRYLYDPERVQAMLLSIEALKRLRVGRLKGYDFFGHLLPGETKE